MTSPSGRATQAREALREIEARFSGTTCGRAADIARTTLVLIPEGSIILTASEVEQIREEIETLCRNVSGGWRDGEPHDPETRATLALLAGGRNPA